MQHAGLRPLLNASMFPYHLSNLHQGAIGFHDEVYGEYLGQGVAMLFLLSVCASASCGGASAC
jgi:hypothetical protein